MDAKPAMCNCEECVNGRTAHNAQARMDAHLEAAKLKYHIAVKELEACVEQARMNAATCRCGHVGAECFNDSYCTPDPTDRITELEDELNWRDMEQETDDATIQQQTTRISELETTIRVLAGLLNG